MNGIGPMLSLGRRIKFSLINYFIIFYAAVRKHAANVNSFKFIPVHDI